MYPKREISSGLLVSIQLTQPILNNSNSVTRTAQPPKSTLPAISTNVERLGLGVCLGGFCINEEGDSFAKSLVGRVLCRRSVR